jgi:predicted enzyme related to lactoylglutathione lyase
MYPYCKFRQPSAGCLQQTGASQRTSGGEAAMATGVPRFGSIVFDCPDPRTLAEFYARLLEWPVPEPDPDGGWVSLANPGGAVGLSFQRVEEEYREPRWPTQEVPQQLHLDLEVDDLEAAHARAVELGARVLDDQGMKPTGFRVYADPAGHPFCLFRD